MTQLTIVAHIHANPDQISLVRSELEKLIALTRPEEGCVNYDLHLDNNNPAHFMVFENWETGVLWQQHMDGPHLKNFMKATDGAVSELILHEMTKVD